MGRERVLPEGPRERPRLLSGYEDFKHTLWLEDLFVGVEEGGDPLIAPFVGLCNSFESDQRFNAWTPKFGIDYDLTDDIMISWRLGTGPTRTQEVLCSSRRQASDPVDCFLQRSRFDERRISYRARAISNASSLLRSASLASPPRAPVESMRTAIPITRAGRTLDSVVPHVQNDRFRPPFDRSTGGREPIATSSEETISASLRRMVVQDSPHCLATDAVSWSHKPWSRSSLKADELVPREL